MDYEVIDKNANIFIIKDVIYSNTENRVLTLQTNKGGFNYFNIDEIISAVAYKPTKADNG